jgi:parvulin-like peptidyl-prolyl isomerase
MYRIIFVCLAVTGLAWGQTTAPASGTQKAKSAHSTMAAPAEVPNAPSAGEVAPGAAVITITGLCEHPAAASKTKAGCKTVITRAAFERIVNALQPDMPASAKRQFAERYAGALILAGRAQERGLDRGPTFEEMMKLMRVQVLAQDLVKNEKDKASQVSDAEIEKYYQSNGPAYQEVTVDRLVVPRRKRTDPDAKSAPNPADSEAAMKKEADDLHARAVAGEDFGKLQAEALQMAGYDVKPPDTRLAKVRRKNFPPDQFQVFDLKPGTVSDVIAGQQAYFIYKMEAKDIMPLADVRDEIRSGLEDQRLQDSMKAIEDSAQPSFDESYFKAPAPPSLGANSPGDPAVHSENMPK